MAAPGRRRLTSNQVLALAAIALGVIALFGNPRPGHRVSVDTRELAVIVGSEVDHVTPAELAGWIITGTADYRLIDLRSPAEFERYHIPTAENVPIAGLPDAGLGRNERIVLYSEGGIHSAQGWFLLKAERYAGVYILRGGLEAWEDEVLHPVPPANPSPQEAAAHERALMVSRFFGGSPGVPADTEWRLALPPPAAATPSAPSVTRGPTTPPTPTRKKPRKEGC